MLSQIVEIRDHHAGLGNGLQSGEKDIWLVGLCQEKEIMLFDWCTQLKLSERAQIQSQAQGSAHKCSEEQ